MSGEFEKRASDAEWEQAVARLLIGGKSVAATDEELPTSAPRIRVRVFGLIGELKVVRR
jgi:hypothetical protein